MKAVTSPTNPAQAERIRANTLHDASLVRRFKAGDQAAFAEIVDRHRRPMFAAAFGLLRNRHDAEEIAQDTFIRAYRALALFRGDSSLGSWLYRITINLSRNRYWYFFRRQRHATESLERPIGLDAGSTVGDLVASDAPDPVRESHTREFSALVTECMTKLNPRQQEILQLRNVRQLSYRRIAATLGISSGTVKSRVARARENLRALLVTAYSTPSPGAFVPGDSWFESTRGPARPAGMRT